MRELDTDFMSTRGHLVADQDWEDLHHGSEARRDEISDLCRDVWQCPRCGVPHVSDDGGGGSPSPRSIQRTPRATC
ncbi:hypothetical protein [Nocardiopsis sp. FIRDI 009]|uniref:hypothetical protein n=1 Tax=Nocardiopsis sp. FIRDI 009 TaxID=714197 RepID=UPI000E25C3F0|nr:hypothetical protein [Nocardiopsis sp. FIRDI 009]